ncbi:MAG TPA: hypothetical protein PKA27_06915 [Fimbriimonadaceae bacterium]|nr:hypothetical protein [Fimbriimonadaceae bacterium]
MKAFVLLALSFASLSSVGVPAPAESGCCAPKLAEPARCKPLSQGKCNACTNCKYCAYCSGGGSCSVCAK